MKKLKRDRLVPIISASVSWLIFAIIGSGRPSLQRVVCWLRPHLVASAVNSEGFREILGICEGAMNAGEQTKISWTSRGIVMFGCSDGCARPHATF